MNIYEGMKGFANNLLAALVIFRSTQFSLIFLWLLQTSFLRFHVKPIKTIRFPKANNNAQSEARNHVEYTHETPPISGKLMQIRKLLLTNAESKSNLALNIAVITRVAFSAAPVENYLRNRPFSISDERLGLHAELSTKKRNMFAKQQEHLCQKRKWKTVFMHFGVAYLFVFYMKMSFFAVDTDFFSNFKGIHCKQE